MKGIDQSTMLTALLAASAGPVLNKYALILLAAIFGAMVTLSRTPQDSLWSAVKRIFRSVAFAIGLTGFLALIASIALDSVFHLKVPTEEFIFPLAFLIALIGDDLFKVKEWGWERIGAMIRGKQ